MGKQVLVLTYPNGRRHTHEITRALTLLGSSGEVDVMVPGAERYIVQRTAPGTYALIQGSKRRALGSGNRVVLLGPDNKTQQAVLELHGSATAAVARSGARAATQKAVATPATGDPEPDVARALAAATQKAVATPATAGQTARVRVIERRLSILARMQLRLAELGEAFRSGLASAAGREAAVPTLAPAVAG